MGTRRKNDFYETPEWATHVLLESIPGITHPYSAFHGPRVLEACAGDGKIANVLKQQKTLQVITNDIDKTKPATYHYDMTDEASWALGQIDWTITNPPFSHAIEILEHAHKHSRIGVAMLLRLSFVEPTFKRQEFLAKFPPQKLIVLPRISFTGDGKTDSVTCAWMVWMPHEQGTLPIQIIPKAA